MSNNDLLLMRGRGRGASSGGGGGVAPFFTETFAGGTTHETGGFLWSNEEGGLDNSTIVAAGDAGAQVESGYTHSLQTTFPGSARPSQVGNRQLNFTLGRSCDEIWLEWRLHVPSNYAHRNNYDPGPPVEPYTDNNKFIVFWADTYSSGWHQPMCELITDGATSNNPSDGKSYVRPIMRYSDSGILTDIPGGGQLLIGSGGPMTPGTWNAVRYYAKKETSKGAADGAWTLWVNGSVVFSATGLIMGATDPAKVSRGVEYGYLLGYANSGFDEDTTFHTQYVKFYDTNPGW